jgi:hypothetical protein
MADRLEDQIPNEFPSVHTTDPTERVGGSSSGFDDPDVQAELERLKTGVDNIVEDRMAGFNSRNPNASPEDRLIAEAGARDQLERILNLPSDFAVPEAEPDITQEEHHRHHEEILDVADEAGDLATEQEVEIIATGETDESSSLEGRIIKDKNGLRYKMIRNPKTGSLNRQKITELPNFGTSVGQAEAIAEVSESLDAGEFDEEKWADEYDRIDPEDKKILYNARLNTQKKLDSKFQAARNGELPELEKEALVKAGKNALVLTMRIVQEYFDPSFVRGMESHGKGANLRKLIQERFGAIATNSGFKETVMTSAEQSELRTPKVDIYEDPTKAAECLRHAYNAAKDNPDMFIGYGKLSMEILGFLQSQLSIKVPESKKDEFRKVTRALQGVEQSLSQYN